MRETEIEIETGVALVHHLTLIAISGVDTETRIVVGRRRGPVMMIVAGRGAGIETGQIGNETAYRQATCASFVAFPATLSTTVPRKELGNDCMT